jgi:hypothetical protein
MTNGPVYPPVYPPFYPVAPGDLPVAEFLAVNGVSLGSYCFMTSDVSGLLTVPAKRGDDVVVPGRHGAIRTPRKRYDVGEIVLPMWIVGCAPDGSIPSHGRMERDFFKRRDELLRLFHAEQVTLTFTRADDVTLSVEAEVVDVMDFTRRWAEPIAQVSVALRLTDPFWVENEDRSAIITSATTTTPHQVSAFIGGTAPITDAVIRFIGPVSNPRLAIGERWVAYNGVIGSGRELVLECRHWHAHSGAGASWEPNRLQIYREPGPEWFVLPPSPDPLPVVFTHTGGGVASVEIAGRRRFLSP